MKVVKDAEYERIQRSNEFFYSRLESVMDFKSDYLGSDLSFDWLDVIEGACPFIDNIVRVPKVALRKTKTVRKIEKSRRVNADSVKDLSKHTNYIDKMDPVDDSVIPKKILDIRSEETYNTYENRFLYTLIVTLDKFVYEKEQRLKKLNLVDKKCLKYEGSTNNGIEKIDIVLELNTTTLPRENTDEKLQKQVEDAKKRLKGVRDYLSSWGRSQMMKGLNKEKFSLVRNPIKKTNLLLKNANFKIAMSLWEFLSLSSEQREDEKDNYKNGEENRIKQLLDHTFLVDYLVSDSIDKSKRNEKMKFSYRSLILLEDEIKRMVDILLSMGVDISEEELLKILQEEINKSKTKRNVGSKEIKKKFKSAMKEYLDKE